MRIVPVRPLIGSTAIEDDTDRVLRHTVPATARPLDRRAGQQDRHNMSSARQKPGRLKHGRDFRTMGCSTVHGHINPYY
jgi:hypothetical protein